MVAIRYILILALPLITLACNTEKNKLQKTHILFSNIIVQSMASDYNDPMCKKFSLDNKQAKTILNKSFIINARIMHDKYDYLPCYVKGTASHNNKQCQWEIRAGGTIEVECNGSNYILACDDCDDLLRD